MGTALTGLEIRDTYDALLKISDNGPLDGTLQVVTDGLGNDSSLSLSTAGASVTGTFLVTGNATLSGYGSGSKTGTVAYNLAVDSSGNIIETAGGVVDGSGTANYVSKWSDANTLTDSSIIDNGSNVGIGQAVDATAKLAVNGAIKSSSPVASSASAWKLGTSNLGGVFVATADYVTVEVNGFIVKLPIAIAPATQDYYDRVISDGGSFEGVLSYESATTILKSN